MNPLSIQYIKGVGPKRAELFAKLGVESLDDLLRHYPRGWQDRRVSSLLSLFRQSAHLVYKGTIIIGRKIPTHSGVGVYKVTLAAPGAAEMEAVWFKRTAGLRYDPFANFDKEMAPGRVLWVIGRPANEDGTEVRVEEHYFADDAGIAPQVDRLVPLYPLTEGLSNPFMRSVLWQALAAHADGIKEILPPSLMQKRNLLSVAQAIRGLHFPASNAELEAARQRIVYEEFLLLAAAWEIKKQQTRTDNKKFSYQIKRTLLTPFRQQLGFELTAPQKRVINEIFLDLESPHPMMRLLQGDVGSGKTVVALSALLLAAENGYQGVFMAPTEILAEQHYLTLCRFLKDMPVKFELLLGRTKASGRKKILERLKTGQTGIIIGTHALLEDDVEFANLSLVVIDEQHRFGVRQRALLRSKAAHSDLLIMTATPIPRTLALSLYGDLDVSVIDALPPGRLPIETRRVAEAEAFALVRSEVAAGRQAYIVHPLIDESEDDDIKSVIEQFERLSALFPEVTVGMIHGRMKGAEKMAAMESFAEGRTKVLVATPVIEVGIDVKNATVMVVQNAERFGLASLHQLRGRVGRGAQKSLCLLVSSGKSETSSERLAALCATNDGFKIGEKDMEMRGPGEFLGTRQHGDMELRAGDLVADKAVLSWAVQDREELFAQDPELKKPEHQAFKQRLLELYSRKWHLIDMA